MESIKKLITLKEASKISGYNQDYLGFLIRNGEIKGAKVGRNWCTTEEEIKRYLLRQKIRQGKLALPQFFSSKKRVINIIAISALILVVFLQIFNLVNYSSAVTPVNARKILSDESDPL